MRKANLVFKDKDDTGTSTEIPRGKLLIGNVLRLPVMAKLNLTYGGEDGAPTITVKIQGYLIAASAWVDLTVATTFTKELNESIVWLHAGSMPKCTKYRLNITAITNTTVDTAYIGTGTVEADNV